MKKAQIETIGLLVIIILLIILATIFISLYLKKPSSIAETRTSTKLSAFLNSISKIDLNNQKLTDLVYDCYFANNCNILQQHLIALTSEFFKNHPFSYTFKADNQEFFTINTCNSGLTADYLFRKENMDFTIILKLC